FAQFLEPVIIGNRFGQFPARPIDAGVKSAPPIAPQGTERHFSGRDRAWPGCQDINQIDQDPARRPKSLRDVVTKIFYTRLRGAVCFFCHAPSVTLDARLVGEAWPPRFLTKLVIKTSEIKKSITKIDITGRTYRIQHYNFTPAIGCMFLPPPLKVIPAKIIKVSPIRVPVAFSPCVNYSLVKPFCLAFFIATEIVRHRKTKENFRLRFIRSLI